MRTRSRKAYREHCVQAVAVVQAPLEPSSWEVTERRDKERFVTIFTNISNLTAARNTNAVLNFSAAKNSALFLQNSRTNHTFGRRCVTKGAAERLIGF